ncbi:hypothetical protein ACJ41O_005459 [Fusarium nematophilum]
MCLAAKCMSRTETTVCFHGRCHEFRFYSVTPTFLAATHYAFAPGVSDERRRADYIQQALSRNLQRAGCWPRELPPELWLMVARLLVEPSAVLTAQEQVHGCDATGDSVLDLTQPIYASYVKIDGRCYVKSLQNIAGASPNKGTRLLLPAPSTEGRDIFVAEDHLGVRQVVFVSPKRRDEWRRNHPNLPGAWWRHVLHKAIPSAATIRSDVQRAGCLIIQTETIGITFSTNKGRTALFGLYGHENVDFRRVATLPRGPCRVYFNQLDQAAGRYDVNLVAFERAAATSQDMLPNPPVSISRFPYTQSNEVWVHSSCTMLHVTEVHACINRTDPHRPVTGMLLCYADGHRECMGHLRLDWVGEPILVGETDKLYICGKRTKKNWGYVAAVTTRAPVSGAEGRWLDVAQAGTLEWWFSSRHSVLYYDSVRLN